MNTRGCCTGYRNSANRPMLMPRVLCAVWQKSVDKLKPTQVVESNLEKKYCGTDNSYLFTSDHPGIKMYSIRFFTKTINRPVIPPSAEIRPACSSGAATPAHHCATVCLSARGTGTRPDWRRQ